MNISSMILPFLFGFSATQQPLYSSALEIGLIVETKAGSYRGLINDSAPHVREFLGIPYAQPPTGELRWLPPQKLESVQEHIYDATQYKPACPQWISKVPSAYNTVIDGFILSGPLSEDCLALSIWTPAEAKDLPVLLFIPGGGFQVGGTQTNYQLPYNWVERTQRHIVVTLNYRVNIFGFPNAAGLNSQNLGILDQRAALEWLHDNIEAFGGDPSKITLWGQSAGGAAVNYHQFAWSDEPLVSGYFAQSGTAFLYEVFNFSDPIQSNFSFVARSLGCDHRNDPVEELDCMRKVPWEDIIDYMGEYGESSQPTTIAFFPVLDGKIVFENYTERCRSKSIADRPTIISTTADEGRTQVPYDPAGVDEAAARAMTISAFLCPAAQSSKLRAEAGLKTYRYVYSGDFPNVLPLEWMNAYHGADLPLLFGTHQDCTNGQGKSTPFEFEVSETMQDLVYSFMLDPYQGLEKHGWESYDSGSMLRFAADGKVMQTVSVDSVDGDCDSAS